MSLNQHNCSFETLINPVSIHHKRSQHNIKIAQTSFYNLIHSTGIRYINNTEKRGMQQHNIITN